MPDFDPAERAREAYELAYARVQLAREEWTNAGQPLTITLHNGVHTLHPLWKALRDAEHDAAKLLELARTKHRGPSPAAVIGQTLNESPAQRLRAIEPPC